MSDYNSDPQVYITSLRDFNEGRLVGEWLDLTIYSSHEEVLEAIGDILKSCDEAEKKADSKLPGYLHNLTDFLPREEWIVTDCEGFPERFYSEHMGFEEVLEWIEDTRGMDEDRKEAYEIYLGHTYHASASVQNFEDAYRGHYRDGLEEYAEELFEDIYDRDTMKALGRYIDYSLVARDLEIDGYYEERVHVFTNE